MKGSQYNIRVPKKWNGTLLIFSHGYVSPAGRAGPVAEISFEDTKGTGTDALSTTLLAKGYALAGSSYTGKGWVAADAVSSADDIYKKFVALRGTPKHTLVWGASFGGLVTEVVAEKYDWVDGALPMCGALGGPNLNFDNLLEAAWAVKTLLLPSLQLTKFTSQDQANAAASRAIAAIRSATADLTHGGAAKVALIADILGMPRKSTTHPTGRELRQFAALSDSLQLYIYFNFAARYDVEQRYGGDPSSTYVPTVPLNAAQVVEITGLHGDATALLGKLSAAQGVAADPTARQALAASGDPSGKLRVPTVTLHVTQDPIVLGANEFIFRNRVAAQQQSARLLQIQVSPPPNSAHPPYGVGHCGFSTQQVLGALNVLNQWVDTRTKPASISGLGADVVPAKALPGWPSGARK